MEEEENGQLQTDPVNPHKTFGRNQESNSTYTHTVQAQYCKAQITNSKVCNQTQRFDTRSQGFDINKSKGAFLHQKPFLSQKKTPKVK